MPFFNLQPSSHKRKKAYQIGEHIGSGGYGEVKAATRLDDGLSVAIKIVNKVAIADLGAQVLRQDTLLQLRHPHIVRLFEWFESKDKFYLVFELAAGGELYDHLMAQVRFKEDEAKEVAHALVNALKFLHSRNIIHRDLKPENVLYRTPPTYTAESVHDDCVISDFGLAAMLSRPDEVLHMHCGSPGYTAPEVYSEEGYSLPSDMWSLGVIVFAMMGGRFPYKRTEPKALAEEARTTKLYFPSTWNTISPVAKDFVRKLLEVDPKKRMTADEALQHPWLDNDKVFPTPDNSPENSDADDYPMLERRPTFVPGIPDFGLPPTNPTFSPLEKASTHTSIKGAL